MIPRQHLPDPLLYLVGPMKHGVSCQLPRHGVEVNAAVFVNAGRLLGHGADVVVQMGVARPGNQRPQRGIQIGIHLFKGGLDLLFRGDTGEKRPDLGI